MYRCVVVTMLMALTAGCAVGPAKEPTMSSAILPAEIRDDLQPGRADFAPDLVYIAQPASEVRYDKILLDPLLYFAPLEQMRLVSPGDRQILMNNFYLLLSRELEKDFTLVRFPEPGAARVQFAVLPVTADAVALDTVSTVTPGSGDDAVVQDLLASPLLKGREFIVEAEWTDSQSGAVLGATVDRHFGRKAIDPDALTSWTDVNELLQDYAVLIRYRLCQYRGAADCGTLPAVLR